MKPAIAILVVITLLTRVHGQSLPSTFSTHERSGLTSLELGAHTRVWGRVHSVTNGSRIFWRTNTYTEVATGLGVLDPASGQYRPSSPEFVVLPNGYAVATNCQHQLIISPRLDDPDGFLDAQLPEGGGRVRSAILGLTLYSPAAGRSLQVAAVKPDCLGEQTGPAEITYFDAFEGLRANVRIRNEIGAYHQDILLLERISPEQLQKLGFGNPQDVRLEAWTEFLVSPRPVVQAPNADASLVSNVSGDNVNFGTARLGEGRAFLDPLAPEQVPVQKQWLEDRFLNESVPYDAILPLMSAFPDCTLAHVTRQGSGALTAARIPQRRFAMSGASQRPPNPEAPRIKELASASLRSASPLT